MLGGGGVLGLLSVWPHFCWGGVGAAKGLLPYFLVPKGNQPTACTLALWWLKFGPTGSGGGGGWHKAMVAKGGGIEVRTFSQFSQFRNCFLPVPLACFWMPFALVHNCCRTTSFRRVAH